MTAPLPLLPEQTPPDPRGLGGLMVLVGAEQRPLPLSLVRVRAEIVGDIARTVVEQRFTNPYTSPLEAVHIFPLPERGAVVEMSLTSGDAVIQAVCQEREEAERGYDRALSRGQRAALLTAERADVHTLRVGNLPPGTEAVVRLVLVERLVARDGRLRWRFPTVIAPRYTPGQPVGHEGEGTSPDTDQSPDASRISPPLRLSGGTTLDLEVRLAGPLRHLASSLHALSLSLDGGGAAVAPAGQATMNADFLLSWSTGEPDAVATRAWTDGRHTLVIVEPPLNLVPPSLPRDAVFVIDISGSMDGAKMTAARRALRTALHGLDSRDRFLLLAFDDRVERFSADFRPYDESSLAAADRWIDALRARGGTEMLPAIKAALAGDTPPERLRTVLFVTDGQASNESQLIAAVAGRRRGARFFTLGIDTAVNASLMEGLARAGGGVATLCTPSDDIEAVVAGLESRFGSPLLSDLVVDGGEAARPEPGVLFLGAPLAALLEGAPSTVNIRGVGAAGPWSAAVTPQPVTLPLGVAWARERVSWLEDEITLKPSRDEALRGEIIRVALAHGIASRFTAFVAVDERVSVSGERVKVVQPVELPQQWASPGAPAPGRAAFPYAPSAPPPPAPMAAAPALFDVPAGAAPTPKRRETAKSAKMDYMPVEDEQDDLMFELAEVQPARARRASPAAIKEMDASSVSGGAGLAATADVGATLAGLQRSDGSFDGDPARTAAALVLLLVLGHSRRAGIRQRVVQKAARWLTGRPEPVAALALALLERAEQGLPLDRDPTWAPLLAAGEEGRMLAARVGA